ncbi:KH domain-containing protein [Tunturiibacter empetritectus]
MSSAANTLVDATPVQRLLLRIVNALVDVPDAVSIEITAGSDQTTFRISVHPSDIGKLIGKQGRTARSIRTIFAACSVRLQHRFSIDIVEDLKPFLRSRPDA